MGGAINPYKLLSYFRFEHIKIFLHKLTVYMNILRSVNERNWDLDFFIVSIKFILAISSIKRWEYTKLNAIEVQILLFINPIIKNCPTANIRWGNLYFLSLPHCIYKQSLNYFDIFALSKVAISLIIFVADSTIG